MNFKRLKYELSQIKDIKPIGKTIEINDALYHVMGMILNKDKNLQLLILKYNDEYSENNDQLNELPNTNRSAHYQRSIESFADSVEKVKIGNLEFIIKESSQEQCRFKEHYMTILFIRFLLYGWNTEDIDTLDIDHMKLITLTFNENFCEIPNFNSFMPICFSIRQNFEQNLVELPLDLNIGSDYPDELLVYGKNDNKKHLIYINQVYLCDMWLEMEKVFDHMKMKEIFTDEELEHKKTEFENIFLKVCPKDMYYPVVKYECEDEISLEFYSRKWLDTKPVYSDNLIGFIMKSNESIGKRGLKLKEALIEEPVTHDISKIEVELFCYNKILKEYEIVI